MQAKDVMTTKVITVSPDTSVAAIASLLLEKRISAVPVVDPGQRVLGIVSEGDLMRRPETGTEPHHSWWLTLVETAEEHAAEYARSHGQRAEDVMTRKVITVSEDTSVAEVARTLEERRIKRVPVVRAGRLVGIVSRSNLLRALATGAGPAPRPATADEQSIREGILDTLGRELGIHAELIGVTVTGATVHIWGVAQSAAEKDAVRVVAENAPGVKKVVDHVGVLPPNVRSLIWAE